MELPLLKETDAKITSSEVLVSALREDFRPCYLPRFCFCYRSAQPLEWSPELLRKIERFQRREEQYRFALSALREEE